MTEMTEARFMELLAAYGADFERWPATERLGAERMLRDAPHRLKDVWESERVFDGLLAIEADAPASVALEAKVLAAAPGGAGAGVRGFDMASLRAWWSGLSVSKLATGGCLAASLALGFVAGYAAEPEPVVSGQYAEMFSYTGAGAETVFLSAVNDSR